MTDYTAIRALFSRYMEGVLSSEEKEELSEAAEIYSLEEWEQILGPMATGVGVDRRFDPSEWEEQLRFILSQPAEADVIPIEKGYTPQPLYKIGNRWYKYAIAAAVLILIAGSVLWLNRDEKADGNENIIAKTTDIEPGRDGAILKLSDGREIVLDSISGHIAEDNGITLVNADGQLRYVGRDKAGSATAYHTITTARGRSYAVQLSDGSRVWLNAGSSLRYPVVFGEDRREVEITGEAYFEVKTVNSQASIVKGESESSRRTPGRKVPFFVRSGEVVTEVLGTKFNVNAYEDEGEIKITLLEGSVVVKRENVNPIAIGGESVKLVPGQSATLHFDKLSAGSAQSDIKVDNDVDLEAVMAWKYGWFEFDQANLSTILRQISRWYDVDIIYESEPGDEKFGGRITRNLPLSHVLKLLEAGGVRFRLEGKKLYVKP